MLDFEKKKKVLVNMKTIKSGTKLENDANNNFKKEKKGHYLYNTFLAFLDIRF